MFELYSNRTYRHLFAAQIASLLGTGLATVALGLLAFDLAGKNVSIVLATIFTIKMVAYVVVAPVAGAYADRLPRRFFLVLLDFVRAGVAISLPFVSEVWQVYCLIFILQSASAAFTPTYQATIPDILSDEKSYTRALSLSRLAYDLENIASPFLAALLLTFMSYNILFIGTFIGFLGSAFFILSIFLPDPIAKNEDGIYRKITRGVRIYMATPRLRGLIALNMAVASSGAMVLVNSVDLVRGVLGLDENALAWTMSAFGLGSIIAALALPACLARLSDRSVMLGGTILSIATLFALAMKLSLYSINWWDLLVAWPLLGLGYSSVLTASGRLLRKSSHEEDRPALFAAQFALSHLCWLVTYPLSGWLMLNFGLIPALAILALLALSGVVVSLFVWSRDDVDILVHTHSNLPLDHPHLQGNRCHSHVFIVDDNHPRWGSQL